MSPTPFTQLVANRIVDAKKKAEDAIQDRDKARAQLNLANERLREANTEAEKTLAKAEIDSAMEELASAIERVDSDEYYLSWLLETDRTSPSTTIVQYAMFGILAALVLGFLMYGIINNSLLTKLSDIATARGLITFLITVITVTIALILSLSTIVSDSPDRAQRFLNGKDLLFALIGILGTIVGFYFGQSLNESGVLAIAPAFISNENSKAGDTIDVVTVVSGGKAPYAYSLSFTPSDVIKDIQTRKSSGNGVISARIIAPKIETKTSIFFTITITDDNGKNAVYDSRHDGKRLVLSP
ncbi:hypothetical protein Pan258_46080 [Symmachiella dynata]|uniref:hypothetical protein n=1 Tax=Symmachiella dynata TaxID=2527995 RepID=UPI00118BA8E7|nr:hypothetical protein [Symmachiella dynata]QDT50529.1 hypothetical protein Pan258_46080 [Symmachiella dynata]